MNTSQPSADLKLVADKRGKVVAVASGKGGVGKTWFSITLAHALSVQGGQALLFDGDLGLANVDIQLGLMPEHDLGAVLADRITLKQCASHFQDGGFDIVAGRSGSGRLANLPTPKLTGLVKDIESLAANYDWIVLDLGAGVDRTVRLLGRRADMVLVVTTDEPTSLTDAYAFVKLTVTDNPDVDLRVIVNMAETVNKGVQTYETLVKACENFLDFRPKLAGVIRSDAKVRDAIRQQTPLLTHSPSAQAAADVEKIARELATPS